MSNIPFVKESYQNAFPATLPNGKTVTKDEYKLNPSKYPQLKHFLLKPSDFFKVGVTKQSEGFAKQTAKGLVFERPDLAYAKAKSEAEAKKLEEAKKAERAALKAELLKEIEAESKAKKPTKKSANSNKGE